MAFSGAVKLGDLNDFIAPSQACVVSLAPKAKLDSAELQVATVQLPTPIVPTGGFQQTQLAGDAVKVSLQDCLACSGCVTSAETVLLEHQSVGELLSALQSGKTVIVSVSPQSRASLAVLHGLSASETLGKLVTYMKALGVRAVLDTSTSRDLALLESAQEFMARYRARHPEICNSAASRVNQSVEPEIEGINHSDRLRSNAHASISQSSSGSQSAALHASSKMSSSQSSVSLSSNDMHTNGFDQHSHLARQPPDAVAKSHKLGSSGTVNQDCSIHPAAVAAEGLTAAQQPAQQPDTQPPQHQPASQEDTPAGPLPMLASACPGWVCYAEKTHGSYILPYISTTKSPQAIMGTLVKRFVSQQLGLDPHQIYHCAVMPCYDKKLESSREDFFLPGTTIPEVDSVLTTAEVQQLIDQQGVQLSQLLPSPVDPLLAGSSSSSCSEDGQLYGVHGGAGGYLEFIFKTAAHQLFGNRMPPGPLQMKTLRNSDFTETSLEVEGKTVLRFAAAYGFRNIQTLVRRIKRSASEYDYVEVMACPSACLNGGGQIKAHKGQTTQQLLNELDESYHAPDIIERHPADNPLVPLVYDQLIGCGQFSPAARSFLHTGYHHRTKSVSASIGDW